MGLQDDIAYVSILIASIGFGYVFRQVPRELTFVNIKFQSRKWVSTLAGMLICYLVSGLHTCHLLTQILGNLLIVSLLPTSWCHLASFAWCFFYLTFFRLSPRLGLPEPPPHTNAIILILTLKLIGIAFEIHDAEMEAVKESKENSEEKNVIQYSRPSVADTLHYCLGHIGLITGPYYKFSTWRGVHEDSWNPAVSGVSGVCETAAMTRARWVPVHVILFLVSGNLFPLSVVETEEWQAESSLLWKLFYMAPIFFNFRMRIYAGFTLSECACIMSGLGAYPVSSKPRPGQGPTKPEELSEEGAYSSLNWETVHNIDEWGSDFVPSMREALRCWNMTVQHWLVFTVYKRFPIKSLRTLMVMLVSSVWHGVHPGYYLSLGSVPFCLMVEDYFRKIVRSRLSQRGQTIYDYVGWFVRMRWFDYLGMGFLLLRIDATLTYWTGVYFAGHLSLVVMGLLGFVVVNPVMKMVTKCDVGHEMKRD